MDGQGASPLPSNKGCRFATLLSVQAGRIGGVWYETSERQRGPFSASETSAFKANPKALVRLIIHRPTCARGLEYD